MSDTSTPAATPLLPTVPLGAGGPEVGVQGLGCRERRRERGAARALRWIAGSRGVTPAQVALAWVHQRAEVHGLSVVPIPGTRKRSRLRENAAAALLRLTAEELAELEPIAGRVVGDRYPDMSATSAAREG